MTIDALPTPPSREDAVNFSTRADAFLGALPTFGTQVNAESVAMQANAASAAASAAAAANSSGVPVWTSGATYAIGERRYSPANGLIYLRKTAGAGTTDPSADATNWQLVGNVLLLPVVVAGASVNVLAGQHVILTAAAATTATLPASPAVGDIFGVTVANGRTDNSIATGSANVNGRSVGGVLVIDSAARTVILKYIGGTVGYALFSIYSDAFAAIGGGGGGAWGSITGTLSAQTDLNAALRVDAGYATANAMSALVIDTTKQLNTKTIGANTTFTFSGAPAQANTYFGLVLANSSGSAVTVTIPSSFSVAQQAAITTFLLPGNAVVEMLWRYDGSVYRLSGEPVAQPVGFSWSFLGTTTARDYTIVLRAPFALDIDEVTSKCVSGTATATIKIDTVALGGTANSVSSAEQTQAHTTANVVAAGQDITVTFTAGAVDPVLTIKGRRK